MVEEAIRRPLHSVDDVHGAKAPSSGFPRRLPDAGSFSDFADSRTLGMSVWTREEAESRSAPMVILDCDAESLGGLLCAGLAGKRVFLRRVDVFKTWARVSVQDGDQ
jgi:hypothetical protein